MALEQYLRERLKHKDMLLMTHVVCGYPSFEENLKALEVMAEFDVDLVELQFPFSEPSADGPLFVKANQAAVSSGVHTRDCFQFMKKVAELFPFKLLMMGYYNTAFKLGEAEFMQSLQAAGGSGYIIPDLPLEEAGEMHRLSAEVDLDPIILMTPTNTDARLKTLGEAAKGFVYAVARKGVTGSKTQMDAEVTSFIEHCRQYTDLPIGVGFGISDKTDMDFLRGKADIAIIGTAALKKWEEGGEDALRGFFSELLG
ncbi:MAG: tryptophan synthase subunit alpha [Porticoccaceae bacterium]|nr:tryptophan synthase subunit alpha [Porticoccaceae bacterium]